MSSQDLRLVFRMIGGEKMKFGKRLALILIVMMVVFCNIGANAATIGMNTHWGHANFTSPYIETSKELGVDWLRDGYDWSAVETAKGEYAIPRPQHGDFPTEVKNAGMNMVWVLGFGNPIYADGGEKVMPTSDNPEYFNAFLKYVEYVAEKYKGKIAVYEVWNEPDIRSFNTGGASGAKYAELLKAVKEVIGSIDSEAKVMGGVVTNEYGFKWGLNTHSYLEEILENDGGNYMDMLSIHVYTQKFNQGEKGKCAYTEEEKTPEIAYCDWLDNFEVILDKYQFNKPVWIDEAGWFTGTQTNSVSEETQAKYTIRSMVLWEDYLSRNNRSGEYICYQMRDSASDGFGIIDELGKRKIAFDSVKAYNGLVGNKDFLSLEINDGIYKALYNSDEVNDKTYVVWSTAGGTANVELSGDAAYVFDYRGNLIETVTDTSQPLTVSVDDAPKFIECVDHRSIIDNISYNKSKNMMTVSGRTSIRGSIDILIKQGNSVVQAEKSNVADNIFSAVFSVKKGGVLSVFAGTEDAYDVKETTVKFDNEASLISQSALAVYDSDTGMVTVSGNIENDRKDENTAIALVPISKNAPYDISDLTYIGQTSLNDGSFSHSFNLKESDCGIFKLLISATNADEVLIKELQIPPKYGYGAVLNSAGRTESTVSAAVDLYNFTSEARRAALVICQYDANRRLLVASVKTDEVAPMTDSKPGSGQLSHSVVVKEGAVYFTAYVWEGLNTLKPVSDPIEIK